ncbi:epimerase [Candidatus Woesearchaeota archaeon]|nr:epimerase [Candidatus Woesearchaeota archaeon]|tara:strand:+ start:97 stop:1047 length:951 start_codon:yes stop_codon:yes gene_type:complete
MKLKGKKVFITGGTGFIGSHLIEKIIDDNEVVVFDNLSRNALENTPIENHKNLKIVKGDVLDTASLDKSIDNADIVIHMAAIAGVGTVISKPTTTLKINLIGSYNVLEACRKKNINRYVSFSTSEVYGPNIYEADEGGMTTLGPIGKPRWMYAMSKLAAEFLADSYQREHGIIFTSIRPFNIYGPRQIGEGAIHAFVEKAVKNETITVHEPGSQIRSWCYVDDIVDAMEEVLVNKKTEGEVINIGNPQATSTTLQTAQTVIRLANSKSRIEFKELKYPEVNIRVPSIGKAKRILGFEPKVSFEEGIKRTIDWYKNQ